MRVFWMNTKEGPKIPVMMVRPGLTIDDIDSKPLYYYTPKASSLKGYANPEMSQYWFDATNEELALFCREYALGPTIMNKGVNRRLTLEANGFDDMEVSISPRAEIESAGFYGIAYLFNTKTEIPPWISYGSTLGEGVVFSDVGSSETPFEYRGYANMAKYSQSGYYVDIYDLDSKPIGGVGVMIRDDTGRSKAITLFQKYGERGFNFYEEYDRKLSVSTVYGAFKLIANQAFWMQQTGDITDDGSEPDGPTLGGGVVDLTDRFSPRIATSAIGLYPLNTEQVSEFTMGLWTVEFVDKFLKSINGDPLDSLISLRWYYGLLSSLDRSPNDCYITLGNTAFNGDLGTQSSIVTKPALSQFISYDCQTIIVPRAHGNFLDLSPFTKIEVDIPYVGLVSLDATEVAGKLIGVQYNIDITTGAALVYVYSGDDAESFKANLLAPCSVGMDIPLNVSGKESITSQMTTAIAGSALTGLGALAGGGVGAFAATNMMSQIASTGDVQRSGGMSSENGSLGNLTPYLRITRPITVAPEDYNEQIGSPDVRSGKVNSFTGYIKVSTIKNLDGVSSIPNQALKEIEQLLKAGVYIE